MRVILFTGKGGAGKTSVAAATALRASEMGYRTIIISTDPAHSLSDSFDIQLGNQPCPIAPNLWGQEVEIYETMESYWGTIRKYVSALLSWQGVDDTMAEEAAALPGMEELANLLYLAHYKEKDAYDVFIIDCAPTGETMRLLSFPETLQWWMHRIFPIQRRAASVVRPVVRVLSDIPMPSKDVFNAIEDLYAELHKIHELLTDCEQSSIRLVVNPEKMVIKEAQRSMTYLSLFGYCTDLIICNRLIPETVKDGYFKPWKDSQKKYHRLIEEGFSPLPILDIPLMEQEVVGLPMLKKMAKAIYGGKDPSKVFYKGKIQQIVKEDGYHVLKLTLPFTSKEKISLEHSGDELDIKVGNYRRNVILPHALRGAKPAGASMEDGQLRIKFTSDFEQKEKQVKGGEKDGG